MATLAGSTIASTYTYLLKMDGTSGVTSSLVKVEDGDATDTSLSVSTVAISVDATDKIYLDAGSDTYIYESGADVLDFYVGGANMLKLTESTLDTIAMIGNTTLTHTVTTAASTPIGLLIDSNTSGVAAQNSVGLHLDFDRTVAGSGTAAHNDIGINLDVNSASLGTSSLIGMDIDVVGATSGTSTATGLAVTVGSADTNYAALFNGGNVGIGTTTPSEKLTVSYGIGTETTLTGVLSLEGTDTESANMGEGSGPSIDFRLPTSTTATHVSARIGCPREGGDEDANAGTLSFYTANTNDATATVKMTILKGGNVGIGTSIPDRKLHIMQSDASLAPANANSVLILEENDHTGIEMITPNDKEAFIRFNDGAAAGAIVYDHATNAMHFATADTTKMIIYGDGEITATSNPAFLVHPASNQLNFAENANVQVVWGTEIFDQGGDFASNTFTAPVTGRYQINCNIYFKFLQLEYDYYELGLLTSNRNYYFIIDPDSFDAIPTFWSITGSMLVDMDASDTLTIQVYAGGTGGDASHDIMDSSYFSGFLAC